MWNDLLAALALLLVLEGILPFLNPGSMRKMLEMVSRVDDRTMRLTGLASMVSGALLLYLVRQV